NPACSRQRALAGARADRVGQPRLERGDAARTTPRARRESARHDVTPATVDLLAVAAHPDDAEVGCGGALILAATSGLRVAVVDLTRGERSTSGTVELRSRERDEASSLLQLSQRLTLDLPDTALGTDPSHRDELTAVVRDLRPRIVLAPHTEDRHPDHAA